MTHKRPLRTGKVLIESREKLAIGSFTFFAPHVVELRNDSRATAGLTLDQVQTGLVVVESHVGPIDSLPGILSLLDFKDVSVEVPLELFIGVVDAELLEAIGTEHFKSEYVQNTNTGRDFSSGCASCGLYRLVEPIYEPLE